MSTTVLRKLTYEDIRAFPDDGKRYELLDGEVFVSPSPTTKHQIVVGNLHVLLRAHVLSNKLGKIFLAPLDVVFDEHNVVQPDLLYVSNERHFAITPMFIHGAPDLAIEVISPSRAAYDRDRKSQLYGRTGVREVWYPDPGDDTLEIRNWSAPGEAPQSRRFSGDEKVVSLVLSGLELTLRQVFVE